MEKSENEKTIQQADNSQQIKCKACGGVMRYSPKTGNLKCIYCGSEQELDKTPIEIEAYDFDKWCDADEVQLKQGEGSATQEQTEVKCGQCGATTTLPENVSSMKCPFCGSSLVLENQKTNRFWKPGAMLPFKIDEKDGRDSYRKWLSGKWFAPTKLTRNVASPNGFKGVYLPFWAYDASTSTYYKGERGTDKVYYEERNGKKERIEETSWIYVSGTVYNDFDNILVAASHTLPVSMGKVLRNWDLDNSVAFQEEFVSGFVTELYDKGFVESLPEAKRLMEQAIDSSIRNKIGGDKQRIHSKSVSYDELMFKLLLLPVWKSSFRYNDKVYNFVVNGRTGQVQGDYPVSVPKVVITSCLVIAALILFYY